MGELEWGYTGEEYLTRMRRAVSAREAQPARRSGPSALSGRRMTLGGRPGFPRTASFTPPTPAHALAPSDVGPVPAPV